MSYLSVLVMLWTAMTTPCTTMEENQETGNEFEDGRQGIGRWGGNERDSGWQRSVFGIYADLLIFIVLLLICLHTTAPLLYPCRDHPLTFLALFSFGDRTGSGHLIYPSISQSVCMQSCIYRSRKYIPQKSCFGQDI